MGWSETRTERAAQYWKLANDTYHRAFAARRPEIHNGYLQLAMAWAALASEVEHGPDDIISAGRPEDAKASHPAPR